MNPVVKDVTERIKTRSSDSRAAYLSRIAGYSGQAPRRAKLSCGNLAHGFAACDAHEKSVLAGGERPNIGIVTAFGRDLFAGFRGMVSGAEQGAASFGARSGGAASVPALPAMAAS